MPRAASMNSSDVQHSQSASILRSLREKEQWAQMRPHCPEVHPINPRYTVREDNHIVGRSSGPAWLQVQEVQETLETRVLCHGF